MLGWFLAIWSIFALIQVNRSQKHSAYTAKEKVYWWIGAIIGDAIWIAAVVWIVGTTLNYFAAS